MTEFNPGNRAKRYLIGFGAGKATLSAHVKFLDATSGDVIFENDFEGIVSSGGESMDVVRGSAKKVAKAAKKIFF